MSYIENPHFESDVNDQLKSNLKCEGYITKVNQGEYLVKGKLRNSSASGVSVNYWAAAPPTYSQSYYGSGHPYANPLMAYENTPNRGAVYTDNGFFEFKLFYPNAYYIGLGTVYISPHVNIRICENNDTNSGSVDKIELGDGIPFRSLTYPPQPVSWPRYDVHFYSGREDLPIRSQEQVLRDSAYPRSNKYPKNFWGLKPPQ
jgi:hypothetical protein